jgi:hypothetical protein
MELPTPPMQITPWPTHRPSDPINAITSAERITDVPLSSRVAELIVIGTVSKVGPARWTTPDGKRPANPWAADNHDYIFTPVSIKVETVVKGDNPGGEVQVSGYGGSVGNDSLTWAGDDLYHFVQGERVMLFLFRGDAPKPQSLAALHLWDVHERFTITKGNRAVNTYQDLPLDEVLTTVVDAA